MDMIGTLGTAAVGAAIGAAAVYVATQDHRQMRHSIHMMTRGAEKALLDLDRMVEHYAK